jgi:hypothetical protein
MIIPGHCDDPELSHIEFLEVSIPVAAAPVILVLPPEPPTQDEIESVLIAIDGITRHAGRTGVFK